MDIGSSYEFLKGNGVYTRRSGLIGKGAKPAGAIYGPAKDDTAQDDIALSDIEKIKKVGFRQWAEDLNKEKLKELREKILDEMGLTEDDLAKMDAGSRASIEKLINDEIQKRLAAASVGADKKKNASAGDGASGFSQTAASLVAQAKAESTPVSGSGPGSGPGAATSTVFAGKTDQATKDGQMLTMLTVGQRMGVDIVSYDNLRQAQESAVGTAGKDKGGFADPASGRDKNADAA